MAQLEHTRAQLRQRKAEEDAPDEDPEEFEKAFAERIRTIREKIKILAPSPDLSSVVTELQQEVLTASRFLNDSVHFLNPYTVTSSQSLLNQVNDEILKAHTALAPRKPFSFSRRTSKKTTNTQQAAPQAEQFEIKLEGIEGLQDQSVAKTDAELHQYNCYQLKNLTNCEIFLPGRLKAIHMLGLKNCRVFVGPVSGAAHITGCEDCVISIAAHQIRIHESFRTHFYVFDATDPIVESVQDVAFAPYNFAYPELAQHCEAQGLTGENRWNQVKDFKWLKKEASPHWRVLEADERMKPKVLN